jgi:rhodanese-related sulfurtransferase
VSSLTGRSPFWVVVVAASLATAACSGGEPPTSTSATSSSARTAAAAVAALPPAEFDSVLADDDVLVVNVHVPDEGSIAGTDATIPYDEVRARSAELPQDRDAPVAVYCKSGRMSADAVSTLRQLGYTDVVELRGGMDAWAAGGRELLPPAG